VFSSLRPYWDTSPYPLRSRGHIVYARIPPFQFISYKFYPRSQNPPPCHAPDSWRGVWPWLPPKLILPIPGTDGARNPPTHVLPFSLDLLCRWEEPPLLWPGFRGPPLRLTSRRRCPTSSLCKKGVIPFLGWEVSGRHYLLPYLLRADSHYKVLFCSHPLPRIFPVWAPVFFRTTTSSSSPLHGTVKLSPRIDSTLKPFGMVDPGASWVRRPPLGAALPFGVINTHTENIQAEEPAVSPLHSKGFFPLLT